MPQVTDLRSTVTQMLPGVLADLRHLVSIPSVSSLPERQEQVDQCAAAVASLLRGVGCPDVRIVREEGQPAVIARFPAPEGAPTVCLYAHHDVQPTGDPTQWGSDPLAATEHEGRLFGRGVADDKAGIAVHLAALRAFDGKPPVGITVFVEGEEEVGSPSLGTILERHQDLLQADAYVICDSANWEVGSPAFTTTLRGLADVVVEVTTLDHPLHSGQYGGPVPDALTALVRLLATLHDDTGSVMIDGLTSAPMPLLDYPTDRLRDESGLIDGVQFIGRGSLAGRLWTQPAVAVLAIDAPSTAEASNTLASVARAKVSVRVSPDQSSDVALQALKAHLLAHAPWGAHVTFSTETRGDGTRVRTDGPVATAARAAFEDAWGSQPVEMGQGGSIPMVADFQRVFPEAEILVTGVCDPDSRIHGFNESLELHDFARACLAEADLLRRLGEASA